MEQIKHTYVEVNGLKLHVAETGSDSSPAVIFLHGFPEIWYTWRHQMIAVAKAGFRAIAPDYRGYGLSDIPQQPENTSFLDMVNDTASILDSLSISKVFVIGKDFGAMVAYTFSLIHPEKVAGVVTLGVPFMPPGFFKSHQALPEGFYMKRWQEPGRAEADFGRFDAKTVVRKIYIMFSRSEIPIASENQEIMDLVDPSTPLPSWFTEEDLSEYGDLYQKCGFKTPLQVPYRSFAEKTGSTQQGVNDTKVEVTALLIMGEEDYVLKFPGMEEYLKSGEVKKYVPNLEIVYLPQGCHFVHEQFPDQIKHSYVQANGLKLHVAEIGSKSSPAVIFLHGFPEMWYTWRHQMVAVAKAGFRVIAPDYRGYGLSDVPAEPEKASFADLVNDTASILDYLSISKVFVIGKDFGSMVGYIFALFHPQKVAGIITLGVPFLPPGFHKSHQALPEGFYMRRWKEPGRAEADFGRFDAKTVVRNIYIMFSRSEIPIAGEDQEIMDLVDPLDPLPSWFTEDDLAVYGELYHKSGFQTALHVPYRSFAEKMGSPQQGPNDLKVEAPALLIMGEKDYMTKLPGAEEYLKSGEVKKYVPNLEIVYLPEGCHFVHEQFPDQVNQLVLNFLERYKC